MKKTYKNIMSAALGSLICLGLALPARAQRGNERTDGGGSTPPPASPPPAAPAPQRSAPAPQPQVQRSNPAPQQQQQRPAPQPQMQRSSPQQQQSQQQVQRGNQQQQQSAPQMQRGSQQQQSNSYNGGQQRPASAGTVQAYPQRDQQQLQFRRTNPNNGSSDTRRYPSIGQRGYSYNNAPRGNNGFNYNHGSGYRSYPGLQYGRNYASPRPQGFFYRNRGYYRTYYTPQIGFSIGVLPYGYYPFYWGQSEYFYSEGLYYTQQDNNYTVVEPPVGATITKLPAKAQAIAINGMQYYELNGVYYQPITRDDGTLVYQIAGKDGELTTEDTSASQDDLPQVGDLVDNLPEGCKILRLNGQKYYVSQEGYYFQEAVDTNGDKVYKISGTPTDEPGN